MSKQRTKNTRFMIWLSFGSWNLWATKWFILERMYIKGYIWTPFVTVERRTHAKPTGTITPPTTP